MQKTWRYKEQNPQAEKKLVDELGISEVIAQLLICRGLAEVEQARYFLKGNLSDLHDPYLLKDMKPAVERLKRAITYREKIMVYGDYDVDGIASVALSVSVLRNLGAEVTHYIPNRLEEGYGLNKEALSRAKHMGVRLILTVDCGICSPDEVQYLNTSGIDAIVTDHHHPRGPIPPACAVVNPLQPGCEYPNKDLAGVGVIFKLFQSLLDSTKTTQVMSYLDLVCLGTVADVVPLSGENRILVKYGLRQLQVTSRAGLRALMASAGLNGKQIDSYHISFILGPRLNAAGRLGSSEKSLSLLLTDSSEEAGSLARELEKKNRDRQKIEAATLKEAISQVENRLDFKTTRVIVLWDRNWHAGVIGIVASKLVERYYRPAVLITTAHNKGRGSGRSIEGFHLFDAVAECSDLLDEFGGHEYAVGLNIFPDNLPLFSQRLNEIACRLISPSDLVPAMEIDLDLPLSKVTDELLKEIENLSPFGLGNPRPVFSSCGLNLKGRPMFIGQNGVKFLVSSGDSPVHEAITFNLNRLSSIPANMDLAYSLMSDTYQNKRTIQLRIEDIKSHR